MAEAFRYMTQEDYDLGAWLSAAKEDPNACAEMKRDIDAWFETFVMQPWNPDG